MHKTLILHINDDDEVKAQREDDQLWITVLAAGPPEGVLSEDGSWHHYNTSTSLELFIDPAHFAALRRAMDVVETANTRDERTLKIPGDI